MPATLKGYALLDSEAAWEGKRGTPPQKLQSSLWSLAESCDSSAWGGASHTLRSQEPEVAASESPGEALCRQGQPSGSTQDPDRSPPEQAPWPPPIPIRGWSRLHTTPRRGWLLPQTQARLARDLGHKRKVASLKAILCEPQTL